MNIIEILAIWRPFHLRVMIVGRWLSEQGLHLLGSI
jgi:hypothetical protein